MSHFPDLYFEEKSITKRFSVLLTPEYHKKSLSELKEAALEILNMEDTHVSDKKRKFYIEQLDITKTKLRMQNMITNIVLSGSNLSMKTF